MRKKRSTFVALAVVGLWGCATAPESSGPPRASQPLVEAAGRGDKAAVERALSQGANINEIGGNGYTALYAAAEKGHLDVVTLLIGKGANPNVHMGQQSCCPGWTPLMIATAENHPTAVQALLEAGSDVNAQNRLGRTALMYAANYGLIQIIQSLVKAGADVNMRPTSEPRLTPLLAAASKGHADAVKGLLELGANMNDTDIHGQTALMLASAKGHIGAVRELIARGIDVDITGQDGINAIGIAVVEGQAEVVDILLEARVKLNVKDTLYGNTPLALAISEGRTQIATKLLNAGADPNLRATLEMTPLMIAAMRGNLVLVELLLEKKVDVNAKNMGGYTAIEIARRGGHKEIVEKLRQGGAIESGH